MFSFSKCPLQTLPQSASWPSQYLRVCQGLGSGVSGGIWLELEGPSSPRGHGESPSGSDPTSEMCNAQLRPRAKGLPIPTQGDLTAQNPSCSLRGNTAVTRPGYCPRLPSQSPTSSTAGRPQARRSVCPRSLPGVLPPQQGPFIHPLCVLNCHHLAVPWLWSQGVLSPSCLHPSACESLGPEESTHPSQHPNSLWCWGASVPEKESPLSSRAALQSGVAPSTSPQHIPHFLCPPPWCPGAASLSSHLQISPHLTCSKGSDDRHTKSERGISSFKRGVWGLSNWELSDLVSPGRQGLAGPMESHSQIWPHFAPS